MENLKIKDLVKGEIYRYDYENKYAIGICSNSETTMTLNIVYSDSQYYKSNTVSENKFKKATPEEKHWLNCCIAKNQFIPYIEAMETFNQNLVGRWVKKIKSDAWDFLLKEGEYDKITEENSKYYLLNKAKVYYKNTHQKFSEYFELMPIGWTPNQQNTQQYEVGKWYKLVTAYNWYAKFVKYENDTWHSSESINIDKERYNKEPGNWSSFKSSNYTATLLTNLSEIQQYLPEGHINKIHTNMFKKDDYIVVLKKPNGNLNYLPPNFCFKQYKNYDALFAEKSIDGTETNCTDVTFLNKSTWRYATKEEIAEYNRLNAPFDVTKLNKKEELSLLEQAKLKYPKGTKYISSYIGNKAEVTGDLEYIAKSDQITDGNGGSVYLKGKWAEIVEKSVNQEISEYVECLEDGLDRTKGKIYKVISSLGNNFTVEDDKSENTWNKNFLKCNVFKLSTKEAYEAQLLLGNNLVENAEIVHQNYPVTPEECFNNETIEIGDLVEIITDDTRYYNYSGKPKGYKFIVRDFNQDNSYAREFVGKKIGVSLLGLKLIKKANNTTTHINKKPDIPSVIQVGNEVTVLDVFKSKQLKSMDYSAFTQQNPKELSKINKNKFLTLTNN